MTTNGTSEERTVTFIHHRSAKRLRVAIGAALTGNDVLKQLGDCKFLDASEATRPISLVCERTKKALPLGTSLVDSGVQDGDTIKLLEAKEGHAARGETCRV